MKVVKKIEKVIAYVLMVTIIGMVLIANDDSVAQAYVQTEENGFKIDKNLYNIEWHETGKIYVKQQVACWDSDFDRDEKLGYAEVKVGFATSKKPIDGKYHQRVIFEANMVPLALEDEPDKQGMSQYLEISNATMDAMNNTYIEPVSSSGSTSYSTTGTQGLNYGGAVGYSKGTWTINGSRNYSLSLASTTQYTADSLCIITNKDRSGRATWYYDYISSGVSRMQNAYLFGSSVQHGLFSWTTPSRYVVVSLGFKVTATFGGGNVKTNERANKLWSSDYELGSATKTMVIRWE